MYMTRTRITRFTQKMQVGAVASTDLGRERHFFFCTYKHAIWYFSHFRVVSLIDMLQSTNRSGIIASVAGAALAASFYFTSTLWTLRSGAGQ